MPVTRLTRAILASWLVLVGHVEAAEPDLRLMAAAKSQDTTAVGALLDEGVDVNAARADGVTALLWAAHWDHVETAQLLLSAGAAVVAAEDQGVTPLLRACENGNPAGQRGDAIDACRAGGLGRDRADPHRARRRPERDYSQLRAERAHVGDSALHAAVGDVDMWLSDWLRARHVSVFARSTAGLDASLELTTDDGTTPLMAASGLGSQRHRHQRKQLALVR